MKNISKIVLLFFHMICIAVLSLILYDTFFTTTEKPVDTSSSIRVLTKEDSDLFYSEEEKDILEKELLGNESVLILLTDKVINDDNLNSILKVYSDEELPYVIFKYDEDTKSLSSISNGLVEFENIEVEDVEYTAIYKYLPQIKSTIYTRIILYKNMILFDILNLLVIIMLVWRFISNLKELFENVSWNNQDIRGIKYKVSFLCRYIKIKFIDIKKLEDKDDIVTKLIFEGKLKDNICYIPLKKYNDEIAIKVEYGNGYISYYEWNNRRLNSKFELVVFEHDKEKINNMKLSQAYINDTYSAKQD